MYVLEDIVTGTRSHLTANGYSKSTICHYETVWRRLCRWCAANAPDGYDGSVEFAGFLLHPLEDPRLEVHNILCHIVQSCGEHLGQEQEVGGRQFVYEFIEMRQILIGAAPLNVVL